MSSQVPVLIVELNEFNPQLLRQAAETLGLQNIKQFLSWRHTATIADHFVEHEGLDPWCQWVSIHTGTPSAEHNVIRLGDVDKLQQRQIWERLGEAGVSTGVWGVMNGSRGNAHNNAFFVSDAWNFTERPHPEALAGFFSLPIYYSKNYMDLKFWRIVKTGLQTLSSLFRELPLRCILSDSWFLLKKMFQAPPGSYFLFGAFELFSARIFLKLRRRHNPNACFVFLNLVAHFQHHDWRGGNTIGAKGKVLFSILDRILGLLLESNNRDQKTVVLNAFTQRNVSQEEHYCYRQISPYGFLSDLGLKPVRVEQCMTNDGHAFFQTMQDRDHALATLKNAKVEQCAAFEVEADAVDPLKLFYRFAYYGPANETTLLEINGQSHPLFSAFKLHAKRTGAHVPEGDIYANGIEFPEHLKSFEVFRFIWPFTQPAMEKMERYTEKTASA